MTEEKTPELNEDLEKLKQCLTLHELDFAERIAKGESTNDAYTSAGLANSPGNDHNDAANLKRQPVMVAYIDAMQRTMANRFGMSMEKIVERMSDIAMTNATDVVEIGEEFIPMNPDGSAGYPIRCVTIKEMSEMTEAQLASISSIKPCRGGLEVKQHDKVKVMETLAKLHGAFTEKQEVKHTGAVEVFAYTGFNGRGPTETK